MLLDFNSNANSKVNNTSTCNTYGIWKKSLLESFKGIPLISNRCNHVQLGIYLLSPFIWKSVSVLNNDTSSVCFSSTVCQFQRNVKSPSELVVHTLSFPVSNLLHNYTIK